MLARQEHAAPRWWPLGHRHGARGDGGSGSLARPSWRRRARLLLALLAGLACGSPEQPAGPVAGDLVVSFGSQVANNGALLLLVTGGPVEEVTAGSGYQVSWTAVGPNAYRLVLTGVLAPGDVLRLRVPDVGAVATYAVIVEAAADRTTFALSDPGLFTSAIRR